MDPVQHFELPTKNLSRAKDFYGSVFGWKLHDMPEFDYTMAYTTEVDDEFMPKESGTVNGGLTVDDTTAVGAVIVATVDDIADRLEKAVAAGAEVVMEPIDIPGIGRYGRIKDTEGNVVGLMQPEKKAAK